MHTAARFVLLAVAAFALLAPAARAATIAVTTTADTIAQDGLCSLREAVFAARYDQPTMGCTGGAGEDVIQLPAGEFRLSAGGGREDNNEEGDLDTGPLSALRVAGAGMGATVIAGGGGDRIFDVFAGSSLGLSDLTLRDGAAPAGQSGGAVRSRGTLTAVRVAFVGNVAGAGVPAQSINDASSEPGGGGGAIASEGQLQIADSVLAANRAGDGQASLEVRQGNQGALFTPSAGGSGGSILVGAGTATLTGVTVTTSRAGKSGAWSASPEDPEPPVPGGSGGAIAVTGGSATIINGTFQGNRAGDAASGQAPFTAPGLGGAVAAVAPGSASITFSTFAGNAVGAPLSGGAPAGASVLGASVGGSILADGGGACSTAVPAPFINVVPPGDASCPGARVAGDPGLEALGDYGGPIATFALRAGSPAIDAVAGVPCPATDARGQLRPRFAACDAGAFEVQPGTPAAAGLVTPGPGAGAPGAGGSPSLIGGSGGARPTIRGLSLSRSAFKTKGRSAGTTIRFELTVAGKVVLSVTKPASGRRSKGKCVASTRRLRKAPRCTRQLPVRGTITKNAKAGANSLRFTGRIGGRRLSPGSYRFVLTLPKTATAPKVSTTKTFRIIS